MKSDNEHVKLHPASPTTRKGKWSTSEVMKADISDKLKEKLDPIKYREGCSSPSYCW